tara:strand:+ start:1201 stop:1539 length:339 start_codon:yes stop_codon:yes gene_type:complete
VSAEWVFYTYTINDVGTTYWYEDERIRLRGDNAFVWFRTKFSENNKLMGRYGSTQTYTKINCDEYSYQFLQHTFYSDFEWTNSSASDTEPSDKTFIPPNSSIEVLADIVCKE